MSMSATERATSLPLGTHYNKKPIYYRNPYDRNPNAKVTGIASHGSRWSPRDASACPHFTGIGYCNSIAELRHRVPDCFGNDSSSHAGARDGEGGGR